MKFLKTIFLIISFLFFFASCSSSSGGSSAASSEGSSTPAINISGSSILSINQDNLNLQANGIIEKINDASIDFYLGGAKHSSFSVATSDNNGIIITFSDISLIEEDASVLLSKGAFIIGGVESEEKIINFVIDTKPPTVSHSPTFSTGVFNATVTFSEQVYNNSSSAIDENNFTLTGFADNGIVPIISISSGKTLALFNNLSFAAADSLTATISLSNIQDGVGNQPDATNFSISNLLAAVRSGNCSGIDFDGGSGVSSDPYQISNLCQLQNIANNLYADYELTANIDASWTRSWNLGSGFSPIGNSSNRFRGTFEGNDYLVDSLFIYRPSTNNIGFFGSINGASISHARLTNVDIQGNVNTGGLVGFNLNSTVQNSSSSGTAQGNLGVGGLVGSTSGSTIQNSSSAGTAQGNQYVGGLVGNNSSGSTIQNSSSASSAQGNQYVGGLVGNNDNNSTVQNSYSAGSAQGNQYVGGLVGSNTTNATIQNSYSAGSAQGSSNVGGLVGDNLYGATTTNSYWNSETSGQNTSPGGDARTSSQFLNANALFPDSDGTWDYGDNLSYPTLTQNVMDATTQALHQVAGMIRLADAAGTDFFGATNLQHDFTMDEASIPTEQDATVFALDVNAEAANNSSRVDFWDCATNSNSDILLDTNSVNGTSVTLQYGAENTIDKTAFEKGTTPTGRCEVVRTNTGSVQAGDVLHLEAVISKGSGTEERTYTRSFKLTLE